MFEPVPPAKPPGRWRRTPRWAKVATVLVTVVAVGLGARWWFYPAHRIARQLHAVHLPAAVRLTNEVIDDQGWFCIDECSSGDRYYVTSLPPEETARAVAAALRQRGFIEVEVNRCASGCHAAGSRAPYEIRDEAWYVWGRRTDGLDASASVGVRADGQPGVHFFLV
jgi:hypothetical protein